MRADILKQRITQEEFGQLVGVTQQSVSRMVSEGKLAADGTAGEWLGQYLARLRAQAAGRLGSEPDGLDLVQERAALSRETRIGQELRNARARADYADVRLLQRVLSDCSACVLSGIDALEGQLQAACPELSAHELNICRSIVASARREWQLQTSTALCDLVAAQLDGAAAPEEDEDGTEPSDESTPEN